MKILIGGLVIIFFTLLVLLIRSTIKINLLLMKDGEDDHIEVNAQAFYGLIKYQKKFPFIDMINDKKNLFEAHINTSATVGNIDIPVGEKKDKALIDYDEIKYYKNKIEEVYKVYNNTINYIRKKLLFEKLNWDTKIGTGDAAETAIITGLFWAVKSSILSVFNSKLRLNDIGVNITPVYETAQLKTRLDCIISLKVGYIIIACIKFVFIKIKLEVGEKIEHASN